MKLLSSLGVLLALAAMTGCAGSQQATHAPNDVFAAMNQELSHTIGGNDVIEDMDDALSHSMGTTMLTSATLVAAPAILSRPMELPDSRMSLAAIAPSTWGGASESVSEIPDGRD